MGVQDEYMVFVRSGKYKQLPTEEELSEEMKEKSKLNEEVPEDSKDVETEDAVQEENGCSRLFSNWWWVIWTANGQYLFKNVC